MSASHHNSDQSARIRERIAREAARLIARGKASSFHAARTRATRWLSQQKLGSADIPSQEEIAHELDALSLTNDWDQLTKITWAALQTFDWLQICRPRLQPDWLDTRTADGVTIHWIVPRTLLEKLEQAVLSHRISVTKRTVEDGLTCLDFYASGVPQTIFIWKGDWPADDEQPLCCTIAGTEYRFIDPAEALKHVEPATDWEELLAESDVDEDGDWVAALQPLLQGLENVALDSQEHPEGNALYHALQVFELGRDKHPYDEEFLWACLLHEVGRLVDVRNPVKAAERILQGRVSERVLFLIRELPAAQELLRGDLSHKGLRKADSFDELLDLARCDLAGRVPGRQTATLQEALDYLGSLANAWDEY